MTEPLDVQALQRSLSKLPYWATSKVLQKNGSTGRTEWNSTVLLTNLLASGYVAAGYIAAPTNAGSGRIISSSAIYPSDDANFLLWVTSSKPTIVVDSTSYYQYDRSNTYHQFYVSNAEMLRAGPTAIQYKSLSARATNSSGTQSIVANTVTALTFGAESYDTGAIHDTGSNTSRLTAPVTGRYSITGTVNWAAEALSTTTYMSAFIRVNGATIVAVQSQPPGASIATIGAWQNVSTDYALSATDYVELCVYFDAGAANRTITSTVCSFAMHYIGGL